MSEQSEKVPLGDFIKQNEVLLSALGIFAALTVLSKEISYKIPGYIFSFSMVGGLLLVWYEAWSKLPKNMSLPLLLFRYVLLWGGVGLVMHWLLEFPLFWDIILFLPASFLILAFIFESIAPIIRSFSLTKKIFGIDSPNKNLIQRIMRGIAASLLFIFSLSWGVYLAFGVNVFLDIIRKNNL